MRPKYAVRLLGLALVLIGTLFLGSCATCDSARDDRAHDGNDSQSMPLDQTTAPAVESEQTSGDLNPQEATISSPNGFALEIYKAGAKDRENIFFSPASIYTAFSMVYEGALGKSQEELHRVFGFASDKDQQTQSIAQMMASLEEINASGKADLSLSNALFCDQRQVPRLNESFRDKLAKHYKSELFVVDYTQKSASADRINSWVEEKTRNRIQDLVSEENFDEETALSILNAIYFKANWKYQFDEANTTDGRFYPDISKRTEWINARMMTQSQSYPVAQFRGFKMLEIPYESQDLSMLLILPDDMRDFEEQLSEDNLSRWMADLRTREAVLVLPKFKLTHKLSGLPDILKAMGIVSSFDRREANLRGIFDVNPNENVYIQDVLHKAFIEVNEEGSEAAASTAVIIGITRSGPIDDQQPFVFRADHPFLYMIRHRPSGQILFMGKLADPSTEE